MILQNQYIENRKHLNILKNDDLKHVFLSSEFKEEHQTSE